MSRVSSDEQAKGYSLDVQSEALEKYCERKETDIAYVFREDHSAKDFNRPAFKEFLAFAKQNKGKIDELLFTTWDRFSRNIQDAYAMIEQLKKLGISVQAIEQPIDFSIPENKVMLALHLIMPEVDNDRRSIKIKGGMRAALKAGRWCRGAPFGYRNTRDENNNPIIVPNQHAQNIKWAFEQASKGTPQVDLLRILKERGTPVSRTRFSLLLRNPVYMGKIEVPSYEDEPYLLIEGLHEGIVTETLYYKVQQTLKRNPSKKHLSTSTRSEVLLLRGVLKCSKCGKKMTGSHSKGKMGMRYAYYHCNHCGQERYRTESANETITEILSSFKFSEPHATLHKALVKDLLQGDKQTRGRKSVQLQKEVTTQEKRIEQLQDKLLDGIITSEDFSLMKTRYMQLKLEAEEELVSMTGDVTEKSILLKKALNAVSELGKSYSKADSDTKARLLSSIFPEMIEFDGNKCRTPKINEAVLLCLNADKGFRGNKSGKLHEKLEVSRLVEPEGFEPSSKPQTCGPSTCLFST